MRLQCQISSNTESVPFNYQHTLTRRLHSFFPDNDFHDDVSLYSFSWLHSKRQIQHQNSLDFPSGAEWFVNFLEERHIRSMLATIITSPTLFYGMTIEEVRIQETPQFPDSMRFFVASPVLVKKFDGKAIRHLTFNDPETNDVMTQTLQTKLRAAGLDAHAESVRVRFDTSYAGAKTKLIDIHGIKNRANACPVIVEGTPEAVAFAWDVGVGHSTGAGFGALR